MTLAMCLVFWRQTTKLKLKNEMADDQGSEKIGNEVVEKMGHEVRLVSKQANPSIAVVRGRVAIPRASKAPIPRRIYGEV